VGTTVLDAVLQATVAARNVVFVTTQAAAMIGSVYVAGRFLDRRRFRNFGFEFDQSWWIDFGFGLVLGAVLITGVFVVEYLAGWLTVTELFWIAQPEFSFWPWFAWSALTFGSVGVYEELVARGYLLKNLSEGLTWFESVGTVGAVTVATIVGVLHIVAWVYWQEGTVGIDERLVSRTDVPPTDD
jgi:hypothetical protein